MTGCHWEERRLSHFECPMVAQGQKFMIPLCISQGQRLMGEGQSFF
jgi:hypothetical protein